jgi:glucokinase
MKYSKDRRIVLTLDAGGTNFAFSAMQGFNQIVEPVVLPAHADNLKKSFGNIVSGFNQVMDKLDSRPVAISFAFPGPADYPNGIIDNVGNLPAYGGGVPLGPMLENEFDIPVYINNDGDLFVYGEAIAGLLPKVNTMLTKARSPKQYQTLFGITLGTGFGAGLVHNGELFTGDNSAATEIWIVRNKVHPEAFAEEGASIRAVRGTYAREAGIKFDEAPEPKDIFEIATGTKRGQKKAAVEAFRELGEVVGDALANAMTLIDGLVVIGGGLAGAHLVFMPALIAEMNGTIKKYNGEAFPRMVQKVFNLEDEKQKKAFLAGKTRKVKVPGTSKTIKYDPMKRIGVGISILGTNKAVWIGAYVFALHTIDKA